VAKYPRHRALKVGELVIRGIGPVSPNVLLEKNGGEGGHQRDNKTGMTKGQAEYAKLSRKMARGENLEKTGGPK